ncbi:Aureobasidin resistance protein Aur1 [Lambiella insularis]|nr:Aureobasidin resistance protein Aur1 [Lambiella insularis]
MSASRYIPLQASSSTLSPTRFTFALPRWVPSLFPHRIRRKLKSRIRSRRSPASSLASLETSFNPTNTLRALRGHPWSFYDAQYLLLLALGAFALCIIESYGPLFKTAFVTSIVTILAIPTTRQFFLPFMPIATWLVFFYSCRFIPNDWRPPIWVRVLPALENIFYGANLSNILSSHKATALDILAWLPYGIIHFGAPVVCSIFMFIFGPPGTVPVFARSFGYMNLVGVAIQLSFPCSPPWYENMYGLAPANYSIAGSPAGLARLDALFGLNLYTSTFTASPMVFGAFPSLHAGSATIEALFMSHVFPQFQPLFIVYTLWLWWATMYLSHHYAVDLVGGSLLAAVIFYIAKSNFLPQRQADKLLRWDYDYVERGEQDPELAPLEDLNCQAINEMSDWAAGSSSSRSSGTVSPVDDSQSLWEGETLASNSETEIDAAAYRFKGHSPKQSID